MSSVHAATGSVFYGEIFAAADKQETHENEKG